MRPPLDLASLPPYLRDVVSEHAGARVAIAGDDVVLPAALVEALGASVASEVGRVLARGRETGVYVLPSREEVETQTADLGAPNPWSREAFNITRQVETLRADPARAARLRQAAEAAGMLAPGSLKVSE